jgi:hypothetical protein
MYETSRRLVTCGERAGPNDLTSRLGGAEPEQGCRFPYWRMFATAD